MTGRPIDRRTVLRSSVLLAATALAAACTPDDPQPPETTTPRPQETPVPTTSSAVLLVYFSRAGENYWNGGRRDLEVGNTAVLATKIVDRLGCDVYEIQAADPYPDSYDETVARNVREQDEDIQLPRSLVRAGGRGQDDNPCEGQNVTSHADGTP